MTRILHVAGSPRGARSRSRALGEHFITAFGPATVETLDIWAEPLPHFDAAMVEGRYRLIRGLDTDDATKQRWAELRAMVDRLLAHNLWLFSTPMWNFGLPYRLKQYLDCVIQPTMAFTNDSSGAVTCHGAGRTAVLIGTGALDTGPEAALAGLDHGVRMLSDNLGAYFGITDIHAVRVMPTFGEEEDVEAVMDRGRRAVEVLALSLSARGDGRG